MKLTNKQATQIYGGTQQESIKPSRSSTNNNRSKRPDIDYQIVNMRKSKAHATYQQAHAAISHAEMSHQANSYSRDLSKFKKRKISQQPKLPHFNQLAQSNQAVRESALKGRQRHHQPIYHGQQMPGVHIIVDDSERPSVDVSPLKTPAQQRRKSGASDQNSFAPTPLVMNNIESMHPPQMPFSTKAGFSGSNSPSKLDTRSLRSIRAQRNNLNVISSAAFNSGNNAQNMASTKLHGFKKSEPESAPPMSRAAAFAEYQTNKIEVGSVDTAIAAALNEQQQLERDLELYENYLRSNQESVLSLDRRGDGVISMTKNAAQCNTQILAGVLSQIGLHKGGTVVNPNVRPIPQTAGGSILRQKKMAVAGAKQPFHSQRKFLGGSDKARGSLSPRRSYQQLSSKTGPQRIPNGASNALSKFDYYEDVHLRQLDETIGEMSYDDDDTREHKQRQIETAAANNRASHQLAASDDGRNLKTQESQDILKSHSRNIMQSSAFNLQQSAATHHNYLPTHAEFADDCDDVRIRETERVNRRIVRNRRSPVATDEKQTERWVVSNQAKTGHALISQLEEQHGSEIEQLVLPDISQQSIGNCSLNASSVHHTTKVDDMMKMTQSTGKMNQAQVDVRLKALPNMTSHASHAIIKSRTSFVGINQQRGVVNANKQQMRMKQPSRKSLDPSSHHVEHRPASENADEPIMILRQIDRGMQPEQNYTTQQSVSKQQQIISSKNSSQFHSSRGGKSTARDKRTSAHKPRNIEALLYNSQPQQYFNDQLLNKFIDEEIERMSRLKSNDSKQAQQFARMRAAGQGSQQFNQRMQASGPMAEDLLLMDHIPLEGTASNLQMKSQDSKIGHHKKDKQRKIEVIRTKKSVVVEKKEKVKRRMHVPEIQQLYNTNIDLSRSLSSFSKSQHNTLSSDRHNRPSSKITTTSNYRPSSKAGKSRSSSKLLHSQHSQSIKAEKKPVEKHEHHHYHIDVNIEQVNNILINCGIVPPTAQIKHNGEEDPSEVDPAASQKQDQSAQRKPPSRCGAQKRTKSYAKQVQQQTVYKSALKDAGKQYHAPVVRPETFGSPPVGPRSPKSPAHHIRKQSKRVTNQIGVNQSVSAVGNSLTVGHAYQQALPVNCGASQSSQAMRQSKPQSRHDRVQRAATRGTQQQTTGLNEVGKRAFVNAAMTQSQRRADLQGQKSLSDFIEEMYLQHGAASRHDNGQFYASAQPRQHVDIMTQANALESSALAMSSDPNIPVQQRANAIQRDNAYGQVSEALSRQVETGPTVSHEKPPTVISDQPQLVLAKNAVNFANQTQVDLSSPTPLIDDSKREDTKDRVALSPPANFEAKKLSSQLRQPAKVPVQSVRTSSWASRGAGTFQHHRPNQLQTSGSNVAVANRKIERPSGSGVPPARRDTNTRASVGTSDWVGPPNNPPSNQHGQALPRKGSSRHSRAESKRGPLVLRSDEAYAEYSTGKNGAMAVRKNSRGGKEADVGEMLEVIDQNTGEIKVLSQSISKINIMPTKEPATAIPRPRQRSPLRIVERELNNQSSVALFLPNCTAGDREATVAPVVKPTIGDFDLHEVVGIGNFGKVMRAFNRLEQRECALKILQKDNIAQMKHVDHVVNEREILKFLSDLQPPIRDNPSQLQHHSSSSSLRATHSQSRLGVPVNPCPFITRFYSSFQDENHLYLELEYIQGCTLLSQIASGNPDVQQNFAFYAAETLLTLHYLHQYKIVYRDLKPENIVLSMRQRGHIKLVDFGFSKSLKVIGKTLTNCGTPVYIAPEIITGIGHGFEVDVWSLGILICELASGTTPFQAESSKAVYERIRMCQPVYNRKVPNIVRDLLDKIFVTDPEMRISLDDMKKHAVFKDFDFGVAMVDRVRGQAPWVPEEELLNELADRDSQTGEPKLKKRGFFAEVMAAGGGDNQKRLSFDDDHFKKFLRANKERNADTFLGGIQTEDMSPKRRRQNPLGDFKFKRINELF